MLPSTILRIFPAPLGWIFILSVVQLPARLKSPVINGVYVSTPLGGIEIVA